MGDMSLEEIELALMRISWLYGQHEDYPQDGSIMVYHELLRDVKNALRQLLDAQKWREIETAPKDGTPVLLCDERTGSMRWAVWAQLPSHAEGHNSDWLGWRDGTIEAGGQTVGVIPTHWRPLPLPPLKEQGEHGDV